MDNQTAPMDESIETEFAEEEDEEAVEDGHEPWDIEDRLYEEWRDRRDMKWRY